MSTKLRAVTRYLIKEQFQLLGWTYLCLFAAFVILPFLMALFTGNLKGFSFISTVSDLGLGVVFGFFIFMTMSLTYEHFKLLIQNGISRKTFWQARILTLLVMSVAGEFIAALYNYGVTAPVHHHSASQFLDASTYSLYAHYFGSNLAINLGASFIFSCLFFIGLGTTGMALGSIFSLLTKFVRRIVIITIPILGFFFLVFVTSTAAGNSHYNFEGLANFVKFLLGYQANGAAGNFNPWPPMLTMVIGSIIMAGIAYAFNRKLRIKQ
ncbi:ABC transporter permease [Lactiplantibacillus daowaiensis]|uniref:ABC transporter permease n=1 Tax=Lactiplantibacillus daowaiensis TaxID=2559918 RepID=A0ABW1S3P8_9LACO|nr:ABC transporter permease [Lactiplantibacillus daowaiensis]